MKIVLINSGNSFNYYNDLLAFIEKVDHLFEPPLSKRVNLEEYTKKLCEEANMYVAIENDEIQAACAYYCTPSEFDYAFLSFIASLKKGLGGSLIEEMIANCIEMGAKGIETQTWETNHKSLKMFKRYNFMEVENVNNRNSSTNSTLLKMTFND